MSRVIALDVGTKTIGVAVSDPLRLFAQPVQTVKRRGVKKDTAVLIGLIQKYDADHVVVGLPLELDGTEERSCRLARQIGDSVGEASGLPVTYTDERFTSVEAERDLIAAGMSRKKRKDVIDQAAAMKILERWLADQA